MKIAIMGAMPEEISLLTSDMIAPKVEEFGGRTYHIGKLYGIETVLVFSRWGKVASATTASTLLNHYKVEQLIFTGVAGATAKHLNIGDIVIGTQLYQHDMDASPIFKKHEIPLTGKVFFDADQGLINAAHNAGKHFISNDINQVISKEILQTFYINNPSVYSGKIASGDMFVNDESKTHLLIKEMPDVLAVEMEGAAVAQVCSEHNVPFVVIRTISDRADHTAAIDCLSFVSSIATHYSRGLIKRLYENSL